MQNVLARLTMCAYIRVVQQSGEFKLDAESTALYDLV